MQPKKPAAALTAGLVAKKGAAAVSDGAPQRGAAPPVATVAGGDLVPMNFRVPAEFKEEFDSYAFNSKPRRKNVQVLKDAFQALKEKEGGQ